MPRVTPRPKSDEILVSLDCGFYVLPDGTEHFIEIGTRVRASHPLVQLAPSSFVPATLDDLEFKAARAAYLESRGIHV